MELVGEDRRGGQLVELSTASLSVRAEHRPRVHSLHPARVESRRAIRLNLGPPSPFFSNRRAAVFIDPSPNSRQTERSPNE